MRRRVLARLRRLGPALGTAVALERELERRAERYEHGRRVRRALLRSRPSR